jgi:hypothetical protein
MRLVWCACFAAVLTTFSGACATTVRQSGPERSPPAGTVLLTAKDLERYAASSTLLQALEIVSPMLVNRGGSVRVMIDNNAPTDPEILNTIRASEVSEVRLIRPSGSARPMTSISPNGDVVAGTILQVITRRS